MCASISALKSLSFRFRRNISSTPFRLGSKNPPDRSRQPLPLCRFFHQLLAPHGSQRVKTAPSGYLTKFPTSRKSSLVPQSAGVRGKARHVLPAVLPLASAGWHVRSPARAAHQISVCAGSAGPGCLAAVLGGLCFLG